MKGWKHQWVWGCDIISPECVYGSDGTSLWGSENRIDSVTPLWLFLRPVGLKRHKESAPPLKLLSRRTTLQAAICPEVRLIENRQNEERTVENTQAGTLKIRLRFWLRSKIKKTVAIELPTKLYIVQGNQLASLKITEKELAHAIRKKTRPSVNIIRAIRLLPDIPNDEEYDKSL